MVAVTPPEDLETRSLDDGIAEYLLACEIEGKSPRTVQAYQESLRLFRRVCEERDLPAALDEFRPAHIYQFLKAVQDSGVSIGTRHRRFRETRTLFSWALRMGYVSRNPFAGIPNVRLEQKVIQPYTPEEVQALLGICDPETAFGCRNRAIILLLLDTGLRASELLQLTLADIQWDERRLHIRWGKGRKQRVVPLCDRPAAAIREYVDRFRGEAPGCLFLGARKPHRPLAAFSLVTLFDRLGRRAGIHHVHAHRFRHTFATWAIENQARELDVQYLLGHSTSAMVRRYAATYDSAKAATAHASFSPANRLPAETDKRLWQAGGRSLTL